MEEYYYFYLYSGEKFYFDNYHRAKKFYEYREEEIKETNFVYRGANE